MEHVIISTMLFLGVIALYTWKNLGQKQSMVKIRRRH
jgi:hypothetical protein